MLACMCPFARVMVFFAVVTASLDVLGDEKEKDQSQKKFCKKFLLQKRQSRDRFDKAAANTGKIVYFTVTSKLCIRD